MSQPESTSDSPGADPFDGSTTDRLISEVLRTLPFPDPTSGLEQRVRGRLRQRRVRRLAQAGSVVVVVLLTGLLFWQSTLDWTGLGRLTVSRTIASRSTRADGSVETLASATLNTGELAVLFALPPVDSLGVLDRGQQMAFSFLEDAE